MSAKNKKNQDLDVPVFVNHTEKPKKSFCERLVKSKFWNTFTTIWIILCFLGVAFSFGYSFGVNKVIQDQIIVNDSLDEGTYYSYFQGQVNEYYFEK